MTTFWQKISLFDKYFGTKTFSDPGTALPHQQQNGGILHQIRFFGCKLKKTNGGILLCDPSAFLRPRERHTLRQRMKQFLAETGNVGLEMLCWNAWLMISAVFQPGEQNDCRRRGVAVGVVLLDRRSDEEVQAIVSENEQVGWIEFHCFQPRQSISDLARQLDPECDKFVQLLLPAHEVAVPLPLAYSDLLLTLSNLQLNRTAIIHGSGVPLQEEQLQLVIELQVNILK